ncbi:MAG: PDZ domain-containing protein [Phycisphaerales bacterium]
MIGVLVILGATLPGIPVEATSTCLRVTQLQTQTRGGRAQQQGQWLLWSAQVDDTLQLTFSVAEPGTYTITLRTAPASDGPDVAAKLWDETIELDGRPVQLGPGRHILELSLVEPGEILLDCIDLRRTGELDLSYSRADAGGTAFLGVSMGDAGPAGVAITRTVDDSAATRAGLLAGDVIVRIEGEPMESSSGVAAAIARRRPGDPIVLDLLRDGNQFEMVVTLGRRPVRRDDSRAAHVIDVLDVRPDQVIADIGFGSGWLSEAIAEKLGPGGVVYAVEIHEQAVRRLRGRALPNVIPVYSQGDDVSLPQDSLDTAMLHDVAAHVDRSGRPRFYATVARALKPDGRLVIFDPHGKARAMLDELAEYGFTPVEDQQPADLDKWLQRGIVFRHTRQP